MEQGLCKETHRQAHLWNRQMSHWQYKCTQTHTNTTFCGLMRREVRMLLWVVDGETL